MKREMGLPIIIGTIVVALCLVGFFFFRSVVGSSEHETPAPAKNPENNPMFKSMRESMKAPPTQNPNAGGGR